MKIIILLSLLSNWLIAARIDNKIGGDAGLSTQNLLGRRGELLPPPLLVEVQELNRVLISELREQYEELKKVKFYLLNGEARLAEVYLMKLAYTHTKLRPIIYRYLGTLAFIDGEFKRSLQHLSIPELNQITQNAKVCQLKVLNMIVLNHTFSLESEWARCKVEGMLGLKKRNTLWLDILVQLKTYPGYGVTRRPFKQLNLAALETDQLKMFLRIGLYLNQENLLVPQLREITSSQLQDENVRDLLGHLYFRLGAYAKSYQYIEDLRSPNAENIKGNLYILRQKYELAYAQFKLALELKQNSQNAMERILPLAWILGDWSEGAKYAERVIASPQTHVNKLTLLAAFQTQKGDYEKARDTLEYITLRSKRGSEVEVTQQLSFVGLMQNKPAAAKKYALQSCEQYDLINCWMLYQLEQWESFPLTIRRAEIFPSKREWEKLSQEEIKDPLKETAFVNQIDIEELDDKLIQLMPNAN